MNNTECRYLIQRRFDGDLEAEEEQALDDFIDQSESCAKFEHQLDQMIQGAEELSLPEDFTPPNPEALARQIQQQLPQQKTSFLTAIANMFGGTKAKPAKKGKSSKPDTKFPHRSKKPRIKEKMDVDDAAISNRLKSLQKTSQQEEYADSREKQSTTSSLGQKLGFESGALMQEENSQLTLAESIKRKIAESQGLSTDEDQSHQVGLMPESDPSFQEDRWSSPPQAESSQTSMPSMPSMPSPSIPMPQQNIPMDSPIGMTPAANLPSGIPQTGQSQSIKLPEHHPGSSIGLAPPGSGSQADLVAQSSKQGTDQAGANWGAKPPKGSQPGQDDPEWGPPPVHGTWDEPQSQPQAQGSWDTGKQEAATSAWDEGTPAGGAQWGQPAGHVDSQAATGQPSNSWSQPGQASEVGQNASWGGASGQSGAEWTQPQPQAVTQTEDSSTSGSWATPPSGKTETPGWGAQTGQTSTDSNAQGGWSTPGQSGSSWGASNQNQAATGAQESVETAASGTWATPQNSTGQKPEVNAAQPQAGSDPGWASNAQNQQGWQTGQSSTASGAWNIPVQNTGEEVQPAQAAGLGTPTQVETESKAPDSWGQAAQNKGASSWGAAANNVEAPAQTQASPEAQQAPGWQAANAASGAWGQTAQTDQTNAGWSAQPTNQSSGWGTSAPNQAEQSGGAAWGSQPQAVSQPVQAVPEPEQQSFDTGGWGQSGGAGAAIQDAARASSESEPVQANPQDTGGWSQAPASENQQTSPGSAWGSAPPAGASGPPGWGTPATVESQDPAQAPGWGQPGVEQGAGSFAQTQEGARKGSWSIPAEQLETGSFKAWDESANATETLSNDMPAAVAAPADRFETPIQERTGSQNSMQDDPQSHWDVPIQEKMRQEVQSQTGGWQEQSTPLTAQTNLGDPAQSHWDLPIQEKIKQSDMPMPQQGEGQTSQAMPGLQAPAPGFPQPVPSPQQPPQPVAQAPSADTQSGLFGKPIDDNTIDQIFSNNLGVPADLGSSAAPPAPAEPVAPTAPMAPPPVPGAWGAPPAEVAPAPMQAPTPPQMTHQSFAPPQGVGGAQAMPQAPVISSLPAKNGADQASDPSNQRNSGIFNLDDSAVDQIFQNMGVPNDSQSAPQPAPQPVPQQVPQPAYAQGIQPPAPPFGAPQPPSQLEMPTPVQAPVAPQPPAQQESSGLFNINDSDMDKMFDKVLAAPAAPSGATTGSQPGVAPQAMQDTAGSVGGAYGSAQMPPQPSAMTGMGQPPMPPALPTPPMPAPPTMPAMPAPQSAPMAHSVPQVPPPKVEGIGKLDASSDTNDGGSGRIAAIGKFLLDQKDLEKLGKITEADQGDVKMRILTMEASADLQSLLKEIGSQEKVIGSVIVGHDGLLIANTMPEEVDAESMGVWALGVYMNTEHVTKKMGHDRVHQVVSRTPRGYVVIADFGGGLLVTITDGTETSTLIPLMRKITDLVS